MLQGLGPTGWFDVATAEKFSLNDEEMVSGIQSHPLARQHQKESLQLFFSQAPEQLVP